MLYRIYKTVTNTTEMKYILYIVIFVFCQKVQSQSDINEEIFLDVVHQSSYSDKNAEIGYLNKVDTGLLNLLLEIFESQSSLVYTAYDRKNGITDSIVLTSTEKKYLIAELKASENFEWNLTDTSGLTTVENTSEHSAVEFLQEDKNRELKIVSKPIFMRDDTIACVFSAHLCCGHIYGHESISLYKLIDDTWTEWIIITIADF